MTDPANSLYETSKYSDLTVTLADGEVLKLHKNIVCKSDFFRAACDGGFRVSTPSVTCESPQTDTTPQRAKASHINFPQDPAKAMKILIMHLYGYKGEEVTFRIVKMDRLPVNLCFDVYDVAIKYFVLKLAEHMEASFESWIKRTVGRMCDVERVRAEDVDDLCWVTRRLDEVQYGESRLREALLQALQSHMTKMLKKGALARFVRERLLSCTNLALDLLKSGGLDGRGLELES